MNIAIKNRQRRIRLNIKRVKKTVEIILGHLNASGELSILFVNDDMMRSLNRKWRGLNRTTDVLSFPAELWRNGSVIARSPERSEGTPKQSRRIGVGSKIPGEKIASPLARNDKGMALWNKHGDSNFDILGDVVISLPRAEKQAREYGMTFNEEINRLLIHGILHLFGYAHEWSRSKARLMQRKEDELINAVKEVYR